MGLPPRDQVCQDPAPGGPDPPRRHAPSAARDQPVQSDLGGRRTYGLATG